MLRSLLPRGSGPPMETHLPLPLEDDAQINVRAAEVSQPTAKCPAYRAPYVA